MSESHTSPLRKEVQDHLRSCEHLLSMGANTHNPPQFSANELAIVNYYSGELAKIVGQLAKM